MSSTTEIRMAINAIRHNIQDIEDTLFFLRHRGFNIDEVKINEYDLLGPTVTISSSSFDEVKDVLNDGEAIDHNNYQCEDVRFTRTISSEIDGTIKPITAKEAVDAHGKLYSRCYNSIINNGDRCPHDCPFLTDEKAESEFSNGYDSRPFCSLRDIGRGPAEDLT